uniref:myelin-associated glycoprotein n=1 Tax=Lonchura striata TaxID=40157 RepID=UPI0012936369|nr:myelin-associated glycoprotein [Lonchura striata domestica]
MPPAVAGLAGSCASIPCRFSFPEELRPGSVQGLWFFGSPYPRHYPPVVARSRPGATHESFAGRARLVGEPALRSCALELGPPLSAELAGRYYFRVDLGGVDLGGYNQYSFSEHAALQVLEEPALEVPPELPQVLEVSGPAEALEGSEVHLGCRAEGRPAPLLTWFRGPQVLREEPGAAELPLHLAQVSPEDSGTYTCVAENRHGRHNRSLELHVAYAPRTPMVNGTLWVLAGERLLLTCASPVHISPVGLARCVCAAAAVPAPAVAFELPWLNATVAEGHRDFALTWSSAGAARAALTLRGGLEPRLAVLCAARNGHGAARAQLRFHHPAGLVWAKVGPVGAVVAFAVVIALVCYLSQSRRK